MVKNWGLKKGVILLKLGNSKADDYFLHGNAKSVAINFLVKKISVRIRQI